MTHFDTPQTICRFGIARRDITPPVGMYHRMWGAARHDRSTGIHRPLTTTAVVLQAVSDKNSRCVLVAIDHCLLMGPEMTRSKERVSEAASIPCQDLVVTFSHTHGAGLMDLDRHQLPGGEMMIPYIEELIERVTDAVLEALDSMQSATIAYAAGTCSLAAHRDFWDEERHKFVCGFNPHRAVDQTVWLARVNDGRGDLLATLVNYACHPTTLAWKNSEISPDYPGAMREVVELATGVPCVFLQGASGDLGPRIGFVGDPAIADANGRQLGYAALSALESLPPPATRMRYCGPVESGATLGEWCHEPLEESERLQKSRWHSRSWTVGLPYREDLDRGDGSNSGLAGLEEAEKQAKSSGDPVKEQELRAGAERARRRQSRLSQLPAGEYPYRMVLWQLGDAFWLSIEGEPYSLLQQELRSRFPQTPILVTTLIEGWLPGYLPPRELYGKGIYQESIALLEPGTLERVIETASLEIGQALR